MTLRELLAPWVPLLEEAAELTEDPVPDEIEDARSSCTLWISWMRWSEPDSEADDHAYSSEAMKVLALIAAVDHDALCDMIRELWPDSAETWLRVLKGQRFKLGVELQSDAFKWLASRCSQFMMNATAPVATNGYKRICQQLEKLMAEGSSEQELTIPVRVRLLVRSPDTPITSYDQFIFDDACVEMVMLASLQNTLHRLSVGTVRRNKSPLLRVSEIQFHNSRTVWSTRAMVCASHIATLGVRVSQVDLRGVAAFTRQEMVNFVPTLQRLLGVSDHENGCDSIWIEASNNIQSLDAIFSALLVTKSVRRVRIDIGSSSTGVSDDFARQRLWQWIAFIAWSGCAVNVVTSLELDISVFQESDVETVETLLAVPDPLESLFPAVSGPACAEERLVVTASTFHLIDPRSTEDEEEPSTITFESPQKNLLVLEGPKPDTNWFTVLLPGWGRAWVATADAVVAPSRRTGSQALVKARPKPHTVLHSARSKSGDLVIALLHHLAGRIQSLCLRDCNFTGPTVRRILGSCPRLEEVELFNMKYATLRHVAMAYNDGSCRAERLRLSLSCEGVEVQQHAYQFFHDLANEHHPMAKSVRVLHFSYESRGHFTQFHASVQRMLEQNRLLCELLVTVGCRIEAGSNREDELDTFQDDCNRLDGVDVVVPLDFDKKLAFLSLVQSTDRESSAIQSLDSHVLTLIFQLAAQKHKRLVRCRFYAYQL